ncbi:hypothetical protein CPB83DRAFT_845345 [Crepidotus variabilis]|uniref:Uncharacterized protein n=1 Tax=Crepidotus variabilis TaxID=179855 RepID=A0A9P6ERE8_9AGAR|nr:hypothetical protein CPB83DRAFT_845345 [Crepidotus variabilis]
MAMAHVDDGVLTGFMQPRPTAGNTATNLRRINCRKALQNLFLPLGFLLSFNVVDGPFILASPFTFRVL